MPKSNVSEAASTSTSQATNIANATTATSSALMIVPRSVNDELIEEALKLAARGIPVVACYGIIANEAGTRCTCSERCKSRGKHPIPKGGFKAATCDATELRRTLEGQLPRNLAIRTGIESGLVVLDCDKRNGGEAALTEYRIAHGSLPTTPTVMTGDGYHYYFRHPGGAGIKSGDLRKGLDIKADGGMVIAPPSRHKSGRDYRWAPGLSIYECELAPVPAALLAMLAERMAKSPSPRPGAARNGDGGIEEGGRHNYIVREAGRLRRQRLERDELEVRLLELNAERCSPPLEEDEVRRIAKDIGAKPAGALTSRNAPGLQRTVASDATWHASLITSEKGHLIGTLANATTILGNDDRWMGVLAFDEFSHGIVKEVAPPWHEHDKPSGEPLSKPKAWNDEDTSRVSAWLAREYGVRVSTEVVHRAVKVVSLRNPKHPIRDYLRALKWDGCPRIETWLASYLGAADTAYTRLVGRLWLISAVARIMCPGCKADHVLILEGPQGRLKSTALRVLASDDHFTDTAFEIGQKDAFLQIGKAWIVELAELATLSRAEAARVKQFFSSAVDSYRPPYGHEVVTVPRQQVFAGTSNELEYLKDDTGNRRYWPVPVGHINIDALSRDRDALWAEAFAQWGRGAVWYPNTDAEHALCRVEQEQRLIADPWVSLIQSWLASNETNTVTTIDVLVNALGIGRGAVSRTHSVRVGQILRQLGAKRRQRRMPTGERTWVYDLPSPMVDEHLKDAFSAPTD